MFSWRHYCTKWAAIAVAISACGSPARDGPTETRSLAGGQAPALAVPGPSEQRFVAAASRAPAGGGWMLLDARPGGHALFGQRLGAPPRSDVRPGLVVRLVTPSGVEHTLADADSPWLDARLGPQPSQFVIAVTHARTLVRVELAGRTQRLLDRRVFPGIDLSSDGKHVVYSRGRPPELDLFRYDLARGKRARLTDRPGPDLLPAFSPDRTRVAFVSSAGGFPALWTRGATGLRRLTERARVGSLPQSAHPPLWLGDLIVFQGPDGVHAVGSSGRWAWSLPGFRDALGIERGRSIALRNPAGEWRVLRGGTR